jgi:uncharacterized membrane protein YqjE
MNLMQFGWRALTDDRPYVKSLVGDLAGMSKLHLELFVAEARVEKARLKRKVMMLALAGITLSISLVFFLLAIMVSAWDTPYRMYALFGVPLLLAIVGAVLHTTASSKASDKAPFERTTSELKKDAAWVMELL